METLVRAYALATFVGVLAILTSRRDKNGNLQALRGPGILAITVLVAIGLFAALYGVAPIWADILNAIIVAAILGGFLGSSTYVQALESLGRILKKSKMNRD